MLSWLPGAGFPLWQHQFFGAAENCRISVKAPVMGTNASPPDPLSSFDKGYKQKHKLRTQRMQMQQTQHKYVSPEHEYLAARSSSKRQEATCDNTLSVWESLFPSPRPSKGRRQSRTRAKVPTNSLVRQNRQSCGNLLQCLKTTLD